MRTDGFVRTSRIYFPASIKKNFNYNCNVEFDGSTMGKARIAKQHHINDINKC